MRIILGCEESQTATKAFREAGHEAYSCDLEPCSGGHPEWHIQDDVLNHLSDGWDMMIAFPPCTYLTNAGVRWLYEKPGRWKKMEKGAKFFLKLLNASIKRKGIENPIPHKYALRVIGRKYDQIIQPYQFGHTEKKATCLWLDGLPLLKETNNVYDEMMKLSYRERSKVHYASPSSERSKLRSKTYLGIAEALAIQWG